MNYLPQEEFLKTIQLLAKKKKKKKRNGQADLWKK
jgi:thioredoxin-related protein